ncbi:hypothetical protein Tco_0496507 [Tanacetum coccineum]
MKRPGKDFSGKVTPLFETMIVQATEDMGKDSVAPTDSHSTPIHNQSSSSKTQNQKSRRKQRKDSGPTEPILDEATNEEHVATPSCDPPQSGDDRMKLTEFMDLCTQLQSRVFALETTKSNQALEIESLKRKVKSLEKRRKSRTPGFNRLRKVGLACKVESSNDVNETQEMNDDNLMFDTCVLEEQEIKFEKVSAGDPVTTAGEVVTTASAITPVRPRAKEIVFHDQEEQVPASTKTFSSSQSQLPQVKDKGKGKMVEPEVPLKKKDQIALDEELALRLHAEEQAELEKERVAQEEASKAAIIEEFDSIQAMIDADEQLAARLQAKEQEQFSIEEKSRMLVEMIAERKKFFAAQRAAEQRSKPPTKNQIRNRMCTYLKNMGGYKHNQLKGRSYEEIQKLFDKAYKQVSSFVPMDSEVVKSSVTRTKGSSKRAGDELESDKSKKQKIDEHVEAKKDDQEEAEMKRHIEIVKDDEVAIDAIPLATKPPVIVEYKIDKDGRIGYFKLIRADGSSKRYSSMIKML